MTKPTNKNSSIDWGWVAFLLLLFFAIILPIIMIAFDFGPTETAETKEEMEQQGYDLKSMSR